jgi:hypothetical protein
MGAVMAGALSGFLYTSAGDSSVLAILFQNHNGLTIRATLALSSFQSLIITLGFLNLMVCFQIDEFISDHCSESELPDKKSS